MRLTSTKNYRDNQVSSTPEPPCPIQMENEYGHIDDTVLGERTRTDYRCSTLDGYAPSLTRG